MHILTILSVPVCFKYLQVLVAVCITSVTVPNIASSPQRLIRALVVLTAAALTPKSRTVMCLRARPSTPMEQAKTAGQRARVQVDQLHEKRGTAKDRNRLYFIRTVWRCPPPTRLRYQIPPRALLSPLAAG